MLKIVKNGEIIFKNDIDSIKDDDSSETTVSLLSIYNFVNEVPISEIKDVIEYQIKCNWEIANEGINNPYGSQVGRTLIETYGDKVEIRARAMAAAGSDARMGGCNMPVVINSGSGNQGMTISLPHNRICERTKGKR